MIGSCSDASFKASGRRVTVRLSPDMITAFGISAILPPDGLGGHPVTNVIRFDAPT